MGYDLIFEFKMGVLVKTEQQIGDLTITVNQGDNEYFLIIMDKAGFCFNREETEKIYKQLKLALEPNE